MQELQYSIKNNVPGTLNKHTTGTVEFMVAGDMSKFLQ
jgi:hypothetical protein